MSGCGKSSFISQLQFQPDWKPAPVCRMTHPVRRVWSQQNLQNPKKDQFVLCDTGGGAVDVVNYDAIHILPTFDFKNFSSHTFPAKEESRFGISFSDYEYMQRYEMNENEKNPNLGNLETVWNSTASHPSYRKRIQVTISSMDAWLLGFDGFPKGRNGELVWLHDPSFHHARIGQLFDRDYVWVVTQTMVSFANLTLWAVHNMLTYKVYPGYWGRKLGPSPSIDLLGHFSILSDRESTRENQDDGTSSDRRSLR